MASIFTKIINREIPSDIVYETDDVIAFKDINPQAPVHVLIVPKKEIPTVDDIADEDVDVMGKLFLAARQIARDQGVAESGYRLLVNTRDHAGQEVHHLHVHLLGGRPLGPMLASRD
jgi:histidine triad (HIT) family protein